MNQINQASALQAKCRSQNAAHSSSAALTCVMLLLAMLLGACTTQLKTPDPGPVVVDPIRDWEAVLDRFVDKRGRVDFDGLLEDRAGLDRYVAYVAGTDFERIKNPDELLAHHINAYNALSMWVVLERGIPDTHAGGNKYLFFYFTKMKIGNKNLSLYEYENDIIRPLGEERVHFALNCMAVSCPLLPKQPFTAKGLQQELAQAAHYFFAEPRNFDIDHDERVVWLSEILDFYPEDFLAKAPGLAEYAAQHAGQTVPEGYTVKFFPYDWRVNNANHIP